MTDALSLTVNILAVVQLAGKLVTLGNTYYSQGSDIQLLIQEIGLLSGVLTLISTTVDFRDVQHAGASILEGPIEECKSQLLELHESLVKHLGGRNKLFRFGRRLRWPLKEQETRALVERIERFKRTFSLGLQVDQMGVNGRIRSDVAELKRSQEEERREKAEAKTRRKYRDALAWLSAPTSNIEKHMKTRRREQPGTSKWLLEYDVFKDWEEDSRSFLWLHGAAGTGKTMLSSFIIDHLTQTLHNERLAYFYCPERVNPVDIYGSLLAQILESAFAPTNRLPDYLETYFDNNRHRRPYEEELKCLILQVFNDIPGGMTIIIDGLEETTDMVDLLQHLRDVNHCFEVKVLITSREELDTISTIRGLLELPIEPALMKDDIELFVAQEVERQPALKRLKPTVKQNVLDTITAEAEGRWSWVVSSLEKLGKVRTDRDIKNVLESIRTGS